jgi:ankyrin repeat protein
LHKAALHGRLVVVEFLVAKGADIHAQDADGWTALHNACSKVCKSPSCLTTLCTLRKGYLDIVRWLCEHGGAAASLNGVIGVDARSRGGWTPLSEFGCLMCCSNTESFSVNAASKGHLPVARYLLTKQSANPLVRNNWGETAYDVSAAVFEVWICEVGLFYFSVFTI